MDVHYVCQSIDQIGQCSAWLEVPDNSSVATVADMAEVFQGSFAVVMLMFLMGYGIAVVLKMIRIS